MKRSPIIPIILVLAIAGGAIWWFTRSQPETSQTAVPAPAPAQAAAPKAVPPPPGSLVAESKPAAPMAPVQRPVAPPAAQPIADAPKSAPASDAPTGDAARTTPEASIAEAIRLLEANDIVDLFKEMAPPGAMDVPPGMSMDQMIQQMQQDPGMQKKMAKSLEALHSIQSEIPAMSHTDPPALGPGGRSDEPALSDGDNTATYQGTLSDGTTRPVVLKKTADGLWYIDDM